MSVKKKFLNTLESLGYEYFQQGTIGADGECPENLITYYVVDTTYRRSYDNEPFLTEWLFFVTFYSYDPELVEQEADRIPKTLKAAGFYVKGKGRDAFSEDKGQTGWTMEFNYLEVRNDEQQL